MEEIFNVSKDEKGLLYLDINDTVSNYELLGILTMMLRRVEKSIIEDEVSKNTL